MRKTLVLLFGILVPAAMIYIAYTGYNVVFEPNVNEEKLPYKLFVKEGTTAEQLYAQLLEDEVLLNPQGFLLLAKNKGLAKVKSGHYVIDQGMSNNTLINALKAGLQEPIRITFNSADNLADLAGKLGKQLLADSMDLYKALKAP
ncbi:MAG: endolytic transglycosylase MltG, partial [Schleiferiaceae bacterium]